MDSFMLRWFFPSRKEGDVSTARYSFHPGALRAHNFALSGTTFRIGPGGVLGAGGGPGAARARIQEAPGAFFGPVLGDCLPRVKTQKWLGNGFFAVEKF